MARQFIMAIRFILAVLVCMGLGGAVQGAELKVLAAEVFKPLLPPLAAQFQTAHGHQLSIAYDSAGKVRSRFQGGEAADIVIIQRPVAEVMAADGRIARDGIATLGRSGLALVVPLGAPQPDISSVSALRQTLLAARSIAYPDPGVGAAAGILFRKGLDTMGIADAVNAKARLMPRTFADFAPTDRADVVIAQPMDALIVPGYTIVGWLPADLQEPPNFTWVAAISVHATQAEAARAFLDFLATQPARELVKAKGMEPGE